MNPQVYRSGLTPRLPSMVAVCLTGTRIFVYPSTSGPAISIDDHLVDMGKVDCGIYTVIVRVMVGCPMSFLGTMLFQKWPVR